jgi:hypothetical protein
MRIARRHSSALCRLRRRWRCGWRCRVRRGHRRRRHRRRQGCRSRGRAGALDAGVACGAVGDVRLAALLAHVACLGRVALVDRRGRRRGRCTRGAPSHGVAMLAGEGEAVFVSAVAWRVAAGVGIVPRRATVVMGALRRGEGYQSSEGTAVSFTLPHARKGRPDQNTTRTMTCPRLRFVVVAPRSPKVALPDVSLVYQGLGLLCGELLPTESVGPRFAMPWPVPPASTFACALPPTGLPTRSSRSV